MLHLAIALIVIAAAGLVAGVVRRVRTDAQTPAKPLADQDVALSADGGAWPPRSLDPIQDELNALIDAYIQKHGGIR